MIVGVPQRTMSLDDPRSPLCPGILERRSGNILGILMFAPDLLAGTVQGKGKDDGEDDNHCSLQHPVNLCTC